MADRSWVMRTYSGHSTARASNALYRTNLAKGQTGLSIAFDLPTQIGYDPDAPQARGEVGKVGVPVYHLGHMRQLLDGIPVDQMNTSMTINATAMWLLGLYIANAEEQGIDPTVLQGTTQNDIIKEYLSRGTYIFPPGPSRRLIVDMVAYTVRHVPKWNPINVCSYHLQEAGATPVQEVAYALATAVAVLDAVRLLENGVASRDDIDTAMKGGCGFPMGPFQLLDLVGLDTSLAILDALYEEQRDPNYAAVPLLRRMVTAELLGRKAGKGFYDYHR